MQTIENWLEEYAPIVLNVYKQSSIPFENLKIGTKLFSLRNGYRSTVGGLFQISSEIIDTKFGRVRNIENPKNIKQRFDLYEESNIDGPWYFQVLVISEEEYSIFSWEKESFTINDIRQLERKKLGISCNNYMPFQSIRGFNR